LLIQTDALPHSRYKHFIFFIFCWPCISI